MGEFVTDEFWLLLAIGFFAQCIDGVLGMAFGVISTSAMLAIGLPPAHASALVHTAEVFTTGASGDDLKPLDVIQIGTTTAEPGIWLETNGRREPLAPRGWEHAL